MLKATAWSIFSAGLFAAGFAYVHARRANARRLAAEVEQRSLRERALMEVLEEPLPADSEAIELELVDIDSLSEREEAYDATSPDDLGALWLSRATQTSGEHTSSSVDDEDFSDEDDELDPAGRPTEPPQRPVEASRKLSR